MGKNYFAVFGLGAFGTYLALELERCGNHVTVVDLDRDLVNDIRDKVSEAVVGDISNEEKPSLIKEIPCGRIGKIFNEWREQNC